MPVPADEWLAIVEREYLRDFVSAGGSAVKVAVTPPGLDKADLQTRIEERAVRDGFTFAFVSAADVKLHMIDRLFHAVARQIDWEALAVSFLREQFVANGYGLPGPERFHIEHIAELNDQEPYQIHREANKWLARNLFRDYAMSQEFRIAMMHLCQAALDTTERDWSAPLPVVDWLCGDLRAVSLVKPLQIYRKITRHNARHMLQSLTHWLRRNGRSGLVLLLDIENYQMTKGEAGEGLSYTTAAMLDAYEVLRQLIDDSDALEGCLILVTAGSAFDGEGPRAVGKYSALKLRIWDDVKARDRDNPLAPLVRLAAPERASRW
jgi:hypothetical protein